MVVAVDHLLVIIVEVEGEEDMEEEVEGIQIEDLIEEVVAGAMMMVDIGEEEGAGGGIVVTDHAHRQRSSRSLTQVQLPAGLIIHHCFPAEDLERRPRLNLKPRSVKTVASEVSSTTQRSSIFGSGKPRDEKEYEVKKERKSSESSDAAPASPT